MTSQSTRDRLAPMALCVAVFAALLLISRLAHAAATGDPSTALAGAADSSMDVWTKDGPLYRQHWLQQGRLLSGLTALAGLGASVVAWHFQGAPVGGIVTALVAGSALFMHPTAVGAKSTGGAS